MNGLPMVMVMVVAIAAVNLLFGRLDVTFR